MTWPIATPRDKLGTPTPTDPFTGLPKRERESIVQFARRHGWEAHLDQDYLLHARLSKDGYRYVDLTLWDKFSIATAVVNGVCLPQQHGFPLRERLEKYLAGVKCVCIPDPNLYYYERDPDPLCEIHGDAL